MTATTFTPVQVLETLSAHRIEAFIAIRQLTWTWPAWNNIDHDATVEVIQEALDTVTAYKNALKPIINENGYANGLFIALDINILSNLRCALSLAQDIQKNPTKLDNQSKKKIGSDFLRSALAQLDVIGVFASPALRELDLA